MKPRNQTIMQKLLASEQQILASTVSEVACYICGKRLSDGHSITAKTMPDGTVLFCDVHYPLE